MSNSNKNLRLLPILGITLTLLGYFYLTFQTYKLNKKAQKLHEETSVLNNKKKTLESEIQQLEMIKVHLTNEAKERDTIITLQSNIISQSADPRTVTKGNQLRQQIKTVHAAHFVVTPKADADVDLADKFESEGFKYLLAKDADQAIAAFRKSENASNSYHQVYEIAVYLNRNRSKLADPDSPFWKEAYQKIVTDYSWKMPEDVKKRMTEKAK